MESSLARKILTINYQFYQSFAGEFSETRGKVQPGVSRILAGLDSQTSILDLGCGNGQISRELSRRHFQGSYLGTDFSPALLKEAARGSRGKPGKEFKQLNLSQEDWSSCLADATFQVILCFAVLHHIPSWEIRKLIIENIRRYLSDTGIVCLSNWQFLKSERFQKRILPWEIVGINQEDVDPGDYLLDWRRGGRGIRYVHHFSSDELEELAKAGGFRIRESFHSDGKEGDLSLYQIWEPI